jgi:hypothetical protein
MGCPRHSIVMTGNSTCGASMVTGSAARGEATAAVAPAGVGRAPRQRARPLFPYCRLLALCGQLGGILDSNGVLPVPLLRQAAGQVSAQAGAAAPARRLPAHISAQPARLHRMPPLCSPAGLPAGSPYAVLPRRCPLRSQLPALLSCHHALSLPRPVCALPPPGVRLVHGGLPRERGCGLRGVHHAHPGIHGAGPALPWGARPGRGADRWVAAPSKQRAGSTLDARDPSLRGRCLWALSPRPVSAAAGHVWPNVFPYVRWCPFCVAPQPCGTACTTASSLGTAPRWPPTASLAPWAPGEGGRRCRRRPVQALSTRGPGPCLRELPC